MLSKSVKPLIWMMSILLFLMVACSSGAPEPTEAPTETEAPEPQTTEEVEPAPEELQEDETASGAIASLDEAKNAVIQIQSEGTFVNPDFSACHRNEPGI